MECRWQLNAPAGFSNRPAETFTHGAAAVMLALAQARGTAPAFPRLPPPSQGQAPGQAPGQASTGSSGPVQRVSTIHLLVRHRPPTDPHWMNIIPRTALSLAQRNTFFVESTKLPFLRSPVRDQMARSSRAMTGGCGVNSSAATAICGDSFENTGDRAMDMTITASSGCHGFRMPARLPGFPDNGCASPRRICMTFARTVS